MVAERNKETDIGGRGDGDDDDDDDDNDCDHDDDDDDDDDDGHDDNYFTVQKHASGKQIMSKSMST